MSQSKQATEEKNANANSKSASIIWLVLLVLLGIVSTVLYRCLYVLSWEFTYDSVFKERPLIPVLALFASAFLVYLAAIAIARRATQNGLLIGVVVGFALLFRVVMVFSYPIQEVDIYRYMWDGEVQTQGVSPFQFSPHAVMAANATTQDPDLKKLAEHRDSDPAVAEVLRRVHYGELPTIYPPTSQLVFRVSAMVTPSGISVVQRLWIMKAVLIAFDLGVLILLIKMLALCRMPVGLSVAYGWCPLLMKEVANSGHLDAIAVFLSVLAMYLLVRLVSQPKSQADSLLGGFSFSVLTALVLAAAVGAKLYPIILAPLVFGGIVRRYSWLTAIGAGMAFAAATLILLLPILPSTGQSKSDARRAAAVAKATGGTQAPQSTFETDPSAGLTKFLKYWEMNDFLFMVTVENLKVEPGDPPIWFSVAPQGLRQWIVKPVSNALGIPISETPFRITRALTSLIFLFIALWFAWRVGGKIRLDDSQASAYFYCEAAFLTLAWFWLLLPTQNPWYWLWALPFVPFMRNRAWFAVSGIVLVYYFRFWMEYHWTGFPVWGTPYQGVAFYDFVLTWFEFAPWFIWLAIEGGVWLIIDSVRKRRKAVVATTNI